VGPFDFVMTLVGFSVGVGNFWRFPYLCYQNGGGVFFIPYFITLITAGVPILFLEISLGQFTSYSNISAWNIYPALKGIGVATTLIIWNLNLYYIVVITWGVYYLYSSFTLGQLPWEYCRESYGPDCFDQHLRNSIMGNLSDHCRVILSSKNKSQFIDHGCPKELYLWDTNYKDSSEYFWENEVLGLSSGLENVGSVQGHLAVCLLVGWILVYACVIRGIKWTGKIVWFTGLFPYMMLIILFIRGITLEGAMEGIKFYLNPDFSKLANGKIWLDAGTQIFWSMSLALGAMPTLGSYNHYRHNCLRDTLIYATVNSCTSMLGGFCIFAVLGYMAHEMNVDVSEVAVGGPGLTFIAYPKAISLMPAGSSIFAVLFFLMIIFLGLDSQFVAVEGFSAQVMDALPRLFNFKFSREVFITLIVIVSYCVGLLMITEGGMYIFQIMDFYSASGIVILFVAFFESVGIAYFYGGMRYVRDLEAMMNFRIPVYFPCCWYAVTPFMCLFIAVFFYRKFEPLSYGGYIYPRWSEFMGWSIAGITCFMIPLGAAVHLHWNRDNTKKMRTAILRPHQVHAKTQQPFVVEKFQTSDDTITVDSNGNAFIMNNKDGGDAKV